MNESRIVRIQVPFVFTYLAWLLVLQIIFRDFKDTELPSDPVGRYRFRRRRNGDSRRIARVCQELPLPRGVARAGGAQFSH